MSSTPHHLFPATAPPAATIARPTRAGPHARSRVRRNLGVVLTAAALVAASSTAATAAPPVSTGQLVQLNSLGGVGSHGATMNERGDIAGASVDADGKSRPVVWWSGERSPTALGIDSGWADAINEKGHIAGYTDGALFLWRAGAVTYLRSSTVYGFGDATINARDQVAGTAHHHDGASRAFVWHRGRMTTLPTPEGATSRAVDINDRGQVVGTITRAGAAAEEAVLWQNGRMTELGTLGGSGSAPLAINERGQVIGNSTVNESYDEHPFLWQRGRMTDLLAGTKAAEGRAADLNDAGMITGYASFGDHNNRAVLWHDGRLTDIGLPGHTGGGSFINEGGDVLGATWADPQDFSVPFRWSNGQTTLYPEPDTDIATTVIGIDRSGTVAVGLETTRFGNIVLRSV